MIVLAHQGGWDETLFVLLPLVVFGWLLWLARRRVDANDGAEDDDKQDGPARSEPID